MIEPMRLAVEGELSIFTAAVVRERLLHALAEGAEVELDLAGVTEIDSAGLQVLLAARKEATAQGRRLNCAECSAAVREILELCGIGAGGDDDAGRATP